MKRMAREKVEKRGNGRTPKKWRLKGCNVKKQKTKKKREKKIVNLQE